MRRFALIAAAAAASVAISSRAVAADLYWDGDGTGQVGGGFGTWDTTLLRWSTTPTGSTYQAWVNANNDNAFFTQTGGLVTLGSAVTARSLTFSSSNYTITGNTLTLTTGVSGGAGPATIEVTNGGDIATVNSIVAGSAGLRKTGSGLLILGGANTFTGNTTIDNGVLRANTASALSSGAITVNSGGVLEIANVAIVNDLTLNNNSTLRGIGAASYSKTNFPTVASGAAVTFSTYGPADTLTIGTFVRNGGGGAQITTEGPGRIVIGSGSATGVTANWILNAAITSVSDANGFGVSTNAVTVNNGAMLGFSSGSPAAYPIMLANGSTLAGGTTAPTYSNSFTIPANATATIAAVQATSPTTAARLNFSGSTFVIGSTTTSNLVFVGNGASGSINFTGATSAIPLLNSITVGRNTQFHLDNSASTTIPDRLANTQTVALVNGLLGVTGNATAGAHTNELFGELNVTGISAISIQPGTNAQTVLRPVSLTRTNNTGVLFARGPSLGAAINNGTGNIVFGTSIAGDLVGAGTGTGNQVRVLPYGVGDVLLAGNPTTFLTYDATNGLRPLVLASEYVTSSTTMSGSTANINFRQTGSIAMSAGITQTNAWLNEIWGVSAAAGGSTLRISSGAALFTTTGNATIGAGANALTLDFNGRTGYLTSGGTNSGSTITLNALLSNFGANPLVLSGAGSTSFVLSNTGNTNPSLVVQGLAIPGSNAGSFGATYSADGNLGASGGTITLSNAALVYTGSSALAANTRPINITSAGGTLSSSNSSGVTTYNGTITGSGTLTIVGNGTTTIGGSSASTFTGPVGITAGTLSVGSDANLGSGGILVLGGGALRTTATMSTARTTYVNSASAISVAPSTTTTMSGLITGTGGSLTKYDTGTLIFSAASNSYTGLTSVNAGTLIIDSGATQLGGGAYTVASGSTLRVDGTIAPTIGTTNSAVTVNGRLSGSGTIRRPVTLNTGATISPGETGTVGAFTLDSISTAASSTTTWTFDYLGPSNFDTINVTGALTLSGTTATINVQGSGLATGSYTILSYGTKTGTFALGTTTLGGFSLSLTQGANATILNIAQPPKNLTWDNDTLAGAAQDGAGTWQDGGNNWWDGSANQGWISTAPDNATFGVGGAGGLITLGSNVRVGALTFNTVTSPYTIGTVGGTNTMTVAGGITANESATINAPTLVETSQSWTVASGETLTSAGGLGQATAGLTLTKAGAGELLVTGPMTFNGTLGVTGGQVTLNNAANSTITATSGNGIISMGSGATLTINGATQSPAVTFTGNGALAYTPSAAGTLTLGVANSHAGGTTGGVNANFVLTNASGFGTGPVNLGNTASNTGGLVNFNLGSTATVANQFNLSSTGNIITAFNIPTAGQTVTLSGKLSGGNAAAGTQVRFTGNADNSTTFILNNTANDFLVDPAAGGSGISLYQGTLAITDNAVLGNANNSLILDVLSTTAGGLRFDGANIDLARSVFHNSSTRINTNGNDATISGVVSGTGATLTKVGAGVLTLSNSANSFTGALAVTNGTVAVPSIASSGNQPLGTATSLTLGSAATSGTLRYTGTGAGSLAKSITIGGAGGGIIQTTSSTSSLSMTSVAGGASGFPVTFDIAGNATLSGTVTGTGSTVTKTGAGNVKLNATANSYTGATTISNGTFTVNGTKTGAGAVSVANSAALAGGGSVTGAVSVAGGGTVSPGDNGAGALTLPTTLTLSNNANAYFDLVGSPDTVAVTGAMSIGAGNAINVLFNPSGVIEGNYTLFTFSNTSSLTTSNFTLGSLAGYTVTPTLNTTSYVINVAESVIDYVWQPPTGGTWNDGSTDFSPAYANGTGNAVFGINNLTADATINTSGAISAGRLVFNEAGTGNFTIDTSGGVLSVSKGMTANDSATVGAYTMTGTNTMNVASGMTLNVTGAISQDIAGRALTKTGTGVLVLSGANTYSGNTTISAGTISTSAANNLGAGALVLNGGSLAATASYSTAQLATLNNVAGNAIAVDSGVTLTRTAAMSGAGGYTKAGAGTLVLQSANTFSGTTTIAGGTLQVDTTTALPTAVTNNANLVFNQGTTATFALAITGSGAVYKTGGGSLGFSSTANTYSGGTTINGGTLGLSSGTNLPTNGAVTVNAGAFDIGSTSNASGTSIGALTINSAGMMRVPSGSGDHYINSLSMTAGSLNFNGAGAFWLHVKTAAGITINPSSTTAIWDGGGSTSPKIQNELASGTKMDINVVGGTTPSGIDLDVGVGLGTSGTSTEWNKTGAGTMRLTVASAPNLTISAGAVRVDSIANVPTGTTLALNGGTFQYTGASGAAARTITASTGGGLIDITNSSTTLSTVTLALGANTVTKVGPGILDLTGSPAATGTININNGTVRALSAGAIGTATINLGATSGSTAPSLYFGTSGATYSNPINVRSGSTGFGFIGYGLTSGSATASGPISLQQSVFIGAPTNTTLNVTGNITGTGSVAYTYNNAANDGVVVVSGTNTYSGNTIVAGGTLRVGSANNVIPDTSAVTVNSGMKLELNNISETIGSLAGAGDVALGSGNLTTGGNDTSTTHTGALGGAGGLNKNGTGAFTLAGPGVKNYSGPTNVNGGKLILNTAYTGGGLITVKNGATLGGNGSTTGTVQVESGGHLAPGSSVATITVAALTLDGGAIYDVEFDAPGPGIETVISDQTIVTGGAVSIGGATLSLTLVTGGSNGFFNGGSGAFANGLTYTIVDKESAGAVIGTFAGLAEGATIDAPTIGTRFKISYVGGTGNDITLTTVPEPGGASLLLIAAATGVMHRRRRRR